METKVCKDCGKEKQIDLFFHNKYGATSICKECYCNKQRRAQCTSSEPSYWQKRRTIKKQLEDALNELSRLKTELKKAQSARLDDFTPRQLLEKLKSLGYKWREMTYTKIETIDFNKI